MFLVPEILLKTASVYCDHQKVPILKRLQCARWRTQYLSNQPCSSYTKYPQTCCVDFRGIIISTKISQLIQLGWPTHEMSKLQLKGTIFVEKWWQIAEECKDNSRVFFALKDFFERNLTPGSCMSPANDCAQWRVFLETFFLSLFRGKSLLES